MRTEVKQDVLSFMESGKKAIEDAVAGVSEEMAVLSPAPGKWSILECVEHVAVSEDYLFGLIGKAQHALGPVVSEKREAQIAAQALDRTSEVGAPAILWPKGKFRTLFEATQHFLRSRERTVEFIETNKEELRAKIVTHPVAGVMNSFEILLLIASHALRHAEQIEEAKFRLAFNKK
jgi:hypothetical protein